MSIADLIARLRDASASIEFNDVMKVIAENYECIPTRFVNGVGLAAVINEASINEGACKIFAFAQLNKLRDAETLACFGAYYRDDVLKMPKGDNSINIRNFIKDGWSGIRLGGEAFIEE